MISILTFLHVIVCLILIIAVLLQSGKAADLAGAFGGAGSQTAFGPRGTATLLSKLTTISAILFMVTSLGFWLVSSPGGKSRLEGVAAEEGKPAAVETVKPETKKEEAVPPAKAASEKDQTEKKNEPID